MNRKPIAMDRQTRHRCCPQSFALWLAIVLIEVGPLPSQADLHETFEAVRPTWRVADHDCPWTVDQHRRVFGVAHQGQGCEFLAYRVGPGTLARLVYPILPTRVINELAFSIWVRASREGIALQVRVVLPRTVDPRTGKELTVWLAGSSSTHIDQWQQLRFDRPADRLEEHVFTLRSQLGIPVDTHEAYVDQIGLNVHTSSGAAEVWIDDLEIRGQVLRTVRAVGSRIGRDDAAAPRLTELRAGFRADMLEVEGRPVSLRAIEYRGESFPFLRQLGFNCVVFRNLPTAAEDQAMAAAGLWWIAPLPLSPDARPYRRLLAWRWPVAVTVRDVDSVRRRMEAYRRRAGAVPVVALVESGVETYSHLFDGLLVYRPVLASTTPLDHYLKWLRQVRAAARMDTPLLAVFDGDLPENVERQIRAFGGQEESLLFAEDSLRCVVLGAAQHGIRSFWFHSRRSLESRDAVTIRRARIFEQLNRQLRLLEPWLAAGKVVARADSDVATVRGVLLQSERARLLLAVRQDPGIACCPPGWSQHPVTLSVDGIPATEDAFLLRPHGLIRLATRQASSLRVVEDWPQAATLALVTHDARAIRFAANQLKPQHEQRLTALRDTMRREWDWTRITIERLRPWLRTDQSGTDDEMKEVGRRYRYLEQLVRAQDGIESERVALELADQLRTIQRSLWELAIRGLDHPATSPASITFYSLPVHWQSAARVWKTTWSPSRLAAGGFENLGHMKQTGWRHTATLDPRVVSQARIVPSPVFAGRGALELSGRPRADRGVLRDVPSIRIDSPPVEVLAGQWIKISGQVQIPRPLTGHVDGLRISDSLGGIALAQTFQHTKGWQPFVFYRVAPDNGTVQIRLELFGDGTVWLDDFRIQVARP